MRRPKGPAPSRDRFITSKVGASRWVWWWNRWRGLSAPRPLPQCWNCGCVECRSSNSELYEMKMPVVVAPAGVQDASRVDPPVMLKKMPSVAEVLCQPSWADDQVKGESALMLFRKGHTWRAILKVETPPLTLSVPGRDLDDVLACLEAVLRSNDVPWTQDPNPLGKRSKKR